MPADDLVAAVQTLQQRTPEPGELPLRLLPVVDGMFLPRPVLESVARGSAADVGLIIGTNRDELTLFAIGDPLRTVDDDSKLRRRVAHAAPSVDVGAVVETYRSARLSRGEGVTPQQLWTAIGTDRVFRWPSLQLAAAQRLHQRATYVYLFTWESPAFGGTLGASHGIEIPFVFRTVNQPVIAPLVGGGPEAEALSAQLSGAIVAFARDGDPSHEGIGRWPSWEPDTRTTMVFGPEGGVEDRPRDEQSVWEQYYPLPAP